jgi:hypothetical protein
VFFKEFRNYLRGQPDHVISVALIVVAMLAAVVALYAPPGLKLATLVWMVAP